jgi:hypothetical protein
VKGVNLVSTELRLSSAELSLIFSYSALQVLDVLTTIRFLGMGYPEGNQFAVYTWSVLGFELASALKIIYATIGFSCMVYLALYSKNKICRKVNSMLVCIFFFLYVGVIIWNLTAGVIL